jgi:hypothetical protein
MDFQGQGLADTGETQALAIIDTTARYVVLLPLMDREATTFIPFFLDRIVFTHGPPDVLHSDDAPEFVGEFMRLLAEATNMRTTTTLGHNARANGTVEVFWRFWNRCMRILTDAQHRIWPTFAARICHAYNSASHESLGGSSPFEIFHGVPARTAFTSVAPTLALEAELPDLDTSDPASFAEAVATSAAAFTRLASHHADYVRSTTAGRLNQQGHPRTYTIGDKVKIRVPPSHEQMIATGRRSSHLASWRGPCTIFARLSTTAYAMTEDATDRRFERVLTNILPCRASTARTQAVYDPATSDPFVPAEIIAVRDAPGTPYYLAAVIVIGAISITAQYYGCRQRGMSKAIFRPAWRLPGMDEITLASRDRQPTNTIACSGVLEFDALRELLVAHNLEFTKANRLRKMSQRVLAPAHDERALRI